MFKTNPKLIISYFMGPIGLLFLTIPLYSIYSTYNFSKSALKIEGIVESIEPRREEGKSSTTYYPTITYSLNEKQFKYTSQFGQKPSPYNVGQTVTLLLDPKSSKVRINTFSELYLGSFITIAVGTILTSIALYFYLSFIQHSRRYEKLKKYGIMVDADFLSVNKSNFVINGNPSFKITVSYKDAERNTSILMESDDIWFDPTSFNPKDRKIKVYLDPKDQSIYSVDTSFLPKHV